MPKYHSLRIREVAPAGDIMYDIEGKRNFMFIYYWVWIRRCISLADARETMAKIHNLDGYYPKNGIIIDKM